MGALYGMWITSWADFIHNTDTKYVFFSPHQPILQLSKHQLGVYSSFQFWHNLPGFCIDPTS